MPSAEQLQLLFGHFPIPLTLAALLFAAAWLLARKRPQLFDPESRTGHLDVWALAVGYAVGHHAIDGLSGIPPTDALDWLPIGLLGIAVVTTVGCVARVPAWVSVALVCIVSLGTLALTLNGFKSYQDAYPFAHRLLVFAALALAMVLGGIAFCELARRLALADFFLLTGIAGTIGVGVLFTAFNTAKMAQILGLTLAVGGAGFVIGIITRTRHVAPAFAAGWLLVWSTLVSNSYFANYELPPLAGLVLLLAMPAAAGIGLLYFGRGPVLGRIAVYTLAIGTAMLAFGLATPLDLEGDEEEDPYADWGDWGEG